VICTHSEFLIARFPYNALRISLVCTAKSEFLIARFPYDSVRTHHVIGGLTVPGYRVRKYIKMAYLNILLFSIYFYLFEHNPQPSVNWKLICIFFLWFVTHWPRPYHGCIIMWSIKYIMHIKIFIINQYLICSTRLMLVDMKHEHQTNLWTISSLTNK
jgi:hypothetical protein